MNTAARLAQSVGAIRRATEAAGSRIRVSELEILLHIAGGIDCAEGLAEATGLSRYRVGEAARFLMGQSSQITIAGDQVTRCSPLRLVERRQHPHKRGFQFRLSEEGRAMFNSIQLPPTQEWSQ
jgi:hypothetical protein